MKIKIAISSNKFFFQKTFPILKKSLIESGFENKDIYLFIGQFDNFYKKIIDDINIFQLDYSCFEYNSLICIVENYIESDYWFLMQDTCTAGKNFKKLLYTRTDFNKEKIALKHYPSMSIGGYKYNYLLKYRDDLIALKNKDYSEDGIQKFKFWTCHNEDYLLWRKDRELCSTYDFENHGFKFTNFDHENIYGAETFRIKEYYPQLDITKYKSNFGSGPIYKTTL